MGDSGVPAGGEGGAPEKSNIYALIIFKWDPEKPLLLSAAVDVSSFPFFHRSTMKEHIIFHSRLIAARTPPGRRQVVEFEKGLGRCFVFNHFSSLCCCALTSFNYPLRVAFGLLNEALKQMQQVEESAWRSLAADAKTDLLPSSKLLLEKYKNPVEADKLLKVQQDLDEVKGVMLRNIDELLQRGEKLEDLMQRSEDLSSTSYQFYRQAKKSNSCCSSLY
ncbi:SNARE protein, putative [Eimeria tenella]|uniref:SNARE protein, putative n=1 Tax=Eimeria tenella TaxID=5802 RepID=U6L8J5_EIMTE|nr:SNARE protein, putative [Eimeria tenella]CDJ44110.1 SNARE protein, putative [Eimeria tenella]|eukprot:XP_013234859.1 SNARE protein, putative [Eimeria tenella]